MRAISAWCFTILLLVWAAPAGAEGSAAPTESWVVARGLTADELGRIAQELASDDAGRREGAVLTLTTLHPESLPGIKKRLRELSRRRPQKDDARAALTAFRHAVGSRRADDGVDIAFMGQRFYRSDARDFSEAQVAQFFAKPVRNILHEPDPETLE